MIVVLLLCQCDTIPKELLLFIDTVHLRNWRNIEKSSLHNCGQFVVIHGKNGMGKSNILEAIYVVSALKSFREHISSNFIQWGTSSAQVDVELRTPYGLRHLTWSYALKKRMLHIDKTKCTNLSSWFSLVRSVLFCPDQISIVKGGPAERRKFLDRARFTASPAYLGLVRNYLKVLEQKKALLRSGKNVGDQIEIWNNQLITYGTRIAIQRQIILEELREPFQKMHSFLSGQEVVSLRLTGISGEKSENIRSFFQEQLHHRQKDELRTRRCLVGPHADDVQILMDGVPAKKFSSQGQVRSIVLALKLAELEAARKRGENPLFLLDDLSSELDRGRTEKLLELLSQRENQIWITTTDPSYLRGIPFSKRSRFLVENGQVKNV